MCERLVSAGKVFKLKEKTDFQSLAAKLKNLRKEEQYNEDNYNFSLQTEVRDLSLDDRVLRGVFSWDIITHIFHRGKNIPVPKTIEASFSFARKEEIMFLTIVEKKSLANNIANQLSEALFITAGNIVESKISPEVLRSFHESNPEDTKVIFFDDIDIPNINKLSLYGSALLNTSLYNDYCDHGQIWYLVFKSKKHGNIVGLTRDTVVTIFNQIEDSDFIDYVMDEIFPLVK